MKINLNTKQKKQKSKHMHLSYRYDGSGYAMSMTWHHQGVSRFQVVCEVGSLEEEGRICGSEGLVEKWESEDG